MSRNQPPSAEYLRQLRGKYSPQSQVRVPTAMTIAGSDSGGGAGIQADLKTFQALGVHGTCVVTALTAQNTRGVFGVHEVPPDFVGLQLDTVCADFEVDAVKTGMLAGPGIVTAVAEGLRRGGLERVVVDPVSVSKHGDPLLAPEAVAVLREELLPLALVVTPNLDEVELLTGFRVETAADLRPAAERMLAFGSRWVLVKGGHLPGDVAVDLLTDGEAWHELRTPRLERVHTHGTGCTLASAIAASLAKGATVVESVETAKRFVTGAIEHGLRLGGGVGPVNPAWRQWQEEGRAERS